MKIVRSSASIIVIVAVMSISAFGQQRPQHIVFTGEVLQIQETNLKEGMVDAYHMVEYKVLKVCKGKLNVDNIRVAHIVGTARNLELGDIVCRRVLFTNEFRDFAESLFKFDGMLLPEELVTDYIFEGVHKPCSCSAT